MAKAKISDNDKTWAMLCHLAALCGYFVPLIGNMLGPFLVWMAKRDQSPFIDQQGKEALNFQITVSIALVVAAMLIFFIIGVFLIPIIAIADLILIIVAAVSAYKGEPFRYPFCLRLVK